MVIVLIIVITFARLKEEISSDHFKYGACERPDISRCIIVSSYNNLWRSILSSLDFRSKVMVSPASITHIADLDHNIFIDLGTSLLFRLSICLNLSLLFII
jgi:hypothetical protein